MKGPRPGISAETTRKQLVEAAAQVLAAKGFEGTTVSAIARQAELTSGAIYAHYEGKSDLLRAVVAARAGAGWEPLEDIDPLVLLDVLEYRAVRRGLASQFDGSMLVEAVVATKRDPAVAETMRSKVGEGQRQLTAAIRSAQGAGSCDPDASPEALARVTLILTLGTLLARSLNLPDIEPDEWTDLIHRLFDSVRPQSTGDDPQ